MKTRRSSAAAVLEFTAREREREGKRESEDAMRRNVEKEREKRVKWKQENERKKEEIQGKGKEGGASIKPNGLELFAPRPTAHKHIHTHTYTHSFTHTRTYSHSLPRGVMAHACSQADRQKEINRALGLECVCEWVSAMCKRHAGGSVCHASGGAMLAGVEGAVCECACAHG